MLHCPLVSFLSKVCFFIIILVNSTETFTGKNYTILKPKKPNTQKPLTVTVNIEISMEDALIEDELKKIENHPSWKLIDDDCGESFAGNRIVGGKNANLGEHPWIARLGRYKIYNGVVGRVDWFCAGSLINKYYIVSAAHCTNNDFFRLIRLGEYDVNSAVDCDPTGVCSAPPQDRLPREVINHEGFTDKVVITSHDISIVLMSEPADFNGWVAPVCLPKKPMPGFVSGIAESIGWGLTVPQLPSYSAVLQTIKLPIITEDDCRKRFYKTLKRGTFCAGGMPNQDSCNGDSGGPLLKVDDYSGIPRYYLTGVVSFGPTNCGNGEAGAYTNVTYHLPWILDHMKRQP